MAEFALSDASCPPQFAAAVSGPTQAMRPKLRWGHSLEKGLFRQ